MQLTSAAARIVQGHLAELGFDSTVGLVDQISSASAMISDKQMSINGLMAELAIIALEIADLQDQKQRLMSALERLSDELKSIDPEADGADSRIAAIHSAMAGISSDITDVLGKIQDKQNEVREKTREIDKTQGEIAALEVKKRSLENDLAKENNKPQQEPLDYAQQLRKQQERDYEEFQAQMRENQRETAVDHTAYLESDFIEALPEDLRNDLSAIAEAPALNFMTAMSDVLNMDPSEPYFHYSMNLLVNNLLTDVDVRHAEHGFNTLHTDVTAVMANAGLTKGADGGLLYLDDPVTAGDPPVLITFDDFAWNHFGGASASDFETWSTPERLQGLVTDNLAAGLNALGIDGDVDPALIEKVMNLSDRWPVTPTGGMGLLSGKPMDDLRASDINQMEPSELVAAVRGLVSNGANHAAFGPYFDNPYDMVNLQGEALDAGVPLLSTAPTLAYNHANEFCDSQGVGETEFLTQFDYLLGTLDDELFASLDLKSAAYAVAAYMASGGGLGDDTAESFIEFFRSLASGDPSGREGVYTSLDGAQSVADVIAALGLQQLPSDWAESTPAANGAGNTGADSDSASQ